MSFPAKRTTWRRDLATTLLPFSLVLAACGDGASGQTASDDGGDGGSADELYAGETLQLVMPVGTGGGVDALGTFVSQHLSNHIPGNPTIELVHEPGGGTVTGANLFEQRFPADGSAIFLSTTSTYIQQLSGNEAVQYDFTAWKPLASACGQSGVFVNTASGFDGSNYDVLPSIQDFKVGLSGWTSAQSVHVLAFDVLGIPVEAVPGYEGTAELVVAFEQEETNVGSGGPDVWRDNMATWLDRGFAAPLFTYGLRDENGEIGSDPMAPEVPTVGELYELIHGAAPSGPEWDALQDIASVSYDAQNAFWFHPDVDEAHVGVLRDAFSSLAEDPDFLAAAADSELLCEDHLYTGDEMERHVTGMQDFDPASVEIWLDVLRANGYEG